MRATAQPTTLDLIFRGLDLCDSCGMHLEPADQIAGLCARCDPPRRAPVHTSVRLASRQGKEGR
jgi:methionyl-tRNA synthetase